MKAAAFAFITLIVGAIASPTFSAVSQESLNEARRNERIVTGQIVQAIENVSRQIREAGLDPLNIDVSTGYELPVPVIFSATALVDSFVFTGLSNIVVQSINFSIIQNRLTFNIVLPRLALSVGNAQADAVLFGKDYAVSGSGSVVITNIRLVGDVRINIGIISGISIRSLSLTFSLGGIQSQLNLNLFGRNVSDRVNTLLGTTIPATLNEFSREINQLLEKIALDIINENLGRKYFI